MGDGLGSPRIWRRKWQGSSEIWGKMMSNALEAPETSEWGDGGERRHGVGSRNPQGTLPWARERDD